MKKYRIVEERVDDEIVYTVQRFFWRRWRTLRVFLFIPLYFETMSEAERFIRGESTKSEPKVVKEIIL